MTRFSCSNVLLAASLLTPLLGYAQEPIFQCTSESGSAAFSDAPCKYEIARIPPAAAKAPAAVSAKAVDRTSKFSVAEEVRVNAFRNRTLTTHQLPRDEATLKSVRTLTTSMDEMSVAKRRHMLASFAVYP